MLKRDCSVACERFRADGKFLVLIVSYLISSSSNLWMDSRFLEISIWPEVWWWLKRVYGSEESNFEKALPSKEFGTSMKESKSWINSSSFWTLENFFGIFFLSVTLIFVSHEKLNCSLNDFSKFLSCDCSYYWFEICIRLDLFWDSKELICSLIYFKFGNAGKELLRPLLSVLLFISFYWDRLRISKLGILCKIGLSLEILENSVFLLANEDIEYLWGFLSSDELCWLDWNKDLNCSWLLKFN